MSIKTVLKQSKLPLVARLYGAVRAVYIFFVVKWKQRAQARYLDLVLREYDEAIALAVYYLKTARVDGDIAEFGVHGVTAEMECRQLDAFGQIRNIHLFDSFRGLPSLSEEDLGSAEVASGAWVSGTNHAPVSVEELRRRLEKLYRLGYVHIYEGFFENTLARIPCDTKFALVIMDANLFSSTDTVLRHLFENAMVAEGAMFMMSSWNASRASPDQSSRKAWKGAVADHGIKYSDEGRYNWGGARFIVHSYRTNATV